MGGHLEEIKSLDPERDHQRIVHLDVCYEFPWDTTRALEFALFRTFASPAVSALLDSTGEFANRAQKRYDDTDIIVSELMEHGYDSERGLRALRRMNQIHGRFEIANEDYLYVLSTFVCEPIRWNERFGWRRFCEGERLAFFYFWREVGRRMGITDIPETYEALDRLNVDYERERFVFAESNQRLGTATVDLFTSWAPRPTRWLARRIIHSMLDAPLIRAFGFGRPSRLLGWLARAALWGRARALRWVPARRRPRLRTALERVDYPGGYEIEALGPPPAGKKG